MKWTTFLLLSLSVFLAQSARAQLTGEWTDENGGCYRIRQVDNSVFWSYEDMPRVRNVFMGYLAGNSLTGAWADLPGGQIQGSGTIAFRIESSNRMVKINESANYRGTVLTRGACATSGGVVSGYPDLSGTWYDYSASTGNAGLVSTIRQQGEQLTFINSYNNQSAGRFLDMSTIVATGWEGGLRARLEDNNRRMVWANGSVWERSRRGETAYPDLSGTWYDYSASTGNAGLVSTIRQNGQNLVFINSYNDQSEGRFLDGSTIIATRWEGGLRARLEDYNRRIVWANGSVWQRARR